MAAVGEVKVSLSDDAKELVRASKPRSGWHSSKLHLALIAMAVLTFVFVFVVAATGSGAGWGEYCIALVSITGTYSGSRVAESFAQRREAR